jgi:hypothetical protein
MSLLGRPDEVITTTVVIVVAASSPTFHQPRPAFNDERKTWSRLPCRPCGIHCLPKECRGHASTRKSNSWVFRSVSHVLAFVSLRPVGGSVLLPLGRPHLRIEVVPEMGQCLKQSISIPFKPAYHQCSLKGANDQGRQFLGIDLTSNFLSFPSHIDDL